MGQGLLIITASRSHSDTTHSIGLLCTSDQPDADLCLTTHNTQHNTSMPLAGFEPANPVSELPQTHAFARAATGTGWSNTIRTHRHVPDDVTEMKMQWPILRYYPKIFLEEPRENISATHMASGQRIEPGVLGMQSMKLKYYVFPVRH